MSESTAGDRLRETLETLGKAIRRADFDAVRACSDRLERLLPELAACSKAEIAALQSLAHRNAACLKGMSDGLRAGQRRLREIASAMQGETYDERGHRRKIGDGDRAALPAGLKRL